MGLVRLAVDLDVSVLCVSEKPGQQWDLTDRNQWKEGL